MDYCKKMTKYFTKYSTNGASSRVRTFQFVENLELVSPLFNHHYLVEKYQGKIHLKSIFSSYFKRLFELQTTNSNVIYVEKEFFPYVPFLIEYMILKIFGIIKKDRKFIIDIDDAVFVNYQKTKIRRFFLGCKIEKLISVSDLVICGSYTLLDYCKSYNKNCVFLPSTYKYTTKNEILSLTHPIKIGWIGTPNTQKYLIEFFEDFPMEFRKFFEFHLIGANSNFLDNLDSDLNVITKTWTQETEGDSISKIHFGIMPITKTDFEF